MRSVKMKGKKGKIEMNGSEGESEENGGLLSLNASGSEESKEVDKSLTKGKRSRASRSKGNDSMTEDQEDNVDPEDDAEQENGNTKSSKRRKKMANDKPTSTQNDGDNDNDDGADESKKEEDEDNEEEYEVEKIVSHRIIKGKRQFLVRWKGYNEDSDTWEPEKDLHCPELIEEFLADEEAEEQAAENSNKKAKPTKTKSPKVEKKGKKSASKSNKTAKNGNKVSNGDKEDEDDDAVDSKKEYEVEKILDVYFKKNKEREFLIRWKGFNANDDTWEPEKNLNCAQLIETFMSKVDKAKSLNPRELRTNPQHTKRYTLSTSEPGRRLSRRNVGKQRATYHQCDQ